VVHVPQAGRAATPPQGLADAPGDLDAGFAADEMAPV
jgi:hypothetical protein